MAANAEAPGARLPAEFAELERFAAWIIPSERERHLKRVASSVKELRPFYDAMLPRMEAVMSLLQRFDIEATPPSEVRNLYYLALSFIEVSHPIELRWSGTSNAGAFLSTRLEIPDRK